VAVAPSPAQVFENKIAGQLQHSNQMDSRQPNLSTSVPKSGLTQSNHIRKHHGARSPILEKITHFELSPRHRDPASPSTEQPAPNAVENRHPWAQSVEYRQRPSLSSTSINQRKYQKTKSLDNFYF
jgi:hypothetical protein